MIDLVVIGAGVLGAAVMESIERINADALTYNVLGFCDDAPEKEYGKAGRYLLLGGWRAFAETHDLDRICFFCAIGNDKIRQKVMEGLTDLGGRFVTVIDPRACVAEAARLGDGCYVGASAQVSAEATLGRGVLVIAGTRIDSDTQLEDYASYSTVPGVKDTL